MFILFSFVVQAISYEYRAKTGNVYGRRFYDTLLLINGVLGPVLLGVAVAALPALPLLFFAAGQEEPLRTVMLYADMAVFGLAYLAFYWFTKRDMLLQLPVFGRRDNQ
jgi:hypothetical protein